MSISYVRNLCNTGVNSGLPANDNVVSFVVKNGNIFAGTDSAGVYLSTNNGESWTAVNSNLPTYAYRITSLTVSGNNIFLGTLGGGSIYLSTDNGESWTAVGVNSGLPNFS